MLELTTDANERIFIFPALIRYFMESKPSRNNQMYSMHNKARTVIAYGHDETLYVMETVDELASRLTPKE